MAAGGVAELGVDRFTAGIDGAILAGHEGASGAVAGGLIELHDVLAQPGVHGQHDPLHEDCDGLWGAAGGEQGLRVLAIYLGICRVGFDRGGGGIEGAAGVAELEVGRGDHAVDLGGGGGEGVGVRVEAGTLAGGFGLGEDHRSAALQQFDGAAARGGAGGLACEIGFGEVPDSGTAQCAGVVVFRGQGLEDGEAFFPLGEDAIDGARPGSASKSELASARWLL